MVGFLTKKDWVAVNINKPKNDVQVWISRNRESSFPNQEIQCDIATLFLIRDATAEACRKLLR